MSRHILVDIKVYRQHKYSMRHCLHQAYVYMQEATNLVCILLQHVSQQRLHIVFQVVKGPSADDADDAASSSSAESLHEDNQVSLPA